MTIFPDAVLKAACLGKPYLAAGEGLTLPVPDGADEPQPVSESAPTAKDDDHQAPGSAHEAARPGRASRRCGS